MCKRLIFLTSVVLVLALAGTNVVFGDVIERRVAASSDDTEEFVLLDGGKMDSPTSSDLELGYEKGVDLQAVGIRLLDIQIPQGATITSAWVQFSADDINNDWHIPNVSLIIEGEMSPNPVTFSENTADITSRPVTTASVVWDIPQWMVTHLMGPDEQTPDISAIIQEIVNQPDWVAGNAIVLMFKDNPDNPSAGTREAEAFDGEPAEAPLLHIEFEEAAAGATITVEPSGDIAAANATAVSGDVIEIATGTYAITEAIEIKDGVTYKGAGSGQTIIDCGVVTRAFVGWGNRSQNDDLPYSETGYPANTSGPKGWLIQGLSIIDGEADYVDKSVRRVGDPAIVPALTVNEILNPNKSTNGGGILLENYAEGTLIDIAFDECYAMATGVDAVDPTVTTYLGSGGAVYMGSATANILNCSFTNNNASANGGAISATNPNLENWDLTIESSTFTNNRCRDDGGAISTVRRNVSIINCVGDGNKTGLDPAIMADNVSSGAYGGFLWITGTDKVAGTSYTNDTPPLEMTNYGGVVAVVGCTIANGEANRGGGIRSESAAQLFITDTSFTNCSATDNGGAIFANSPSPFNPAAFDPNDPNSSPVGDPGVYIDGVTIDGCIAEDDGGGINIDNWRTTSDNNYIDLPKVVISNSVVKNCRAGKPAPDNGNRDGGGILVNNRLDVTITNTLVESCTAGRNAAGIYFAGVVNTALIDRCRISNCTNDDISGEGGDGVALNMEEDDNANVVVTNCIFENNINMQDDGAVRIDGDNIIVANCTFVGNKTADHGILFFNTGRADPLVVTNKAVNNLFVNNDSSLGSDNIIDWNKDENNNITLNNGFFGSILDNDSQIEDIADADMGLTGNFIATVDPLVDTAGGDYHLSPGSEAVDKGIAEDAPDHDFDGAPRPQGAAHDVGAYEFGAN